LTNQQTAINIWPKDLGRLHPSSRLLGEVDPLAEQTEVGPTVDPLSSLGLDVVLELQELGNSALVPASE
jgi:hypothetical protein